MADSPSFNFGAGNPGDAAKKGGKGEPAFKSPRYIVIEGPIRVGKSTLAKVLAEQLHARRVFDCEDNPFLADFYDEKPGAAFRAQMYFLYDRHRRLIETRPEDDRGAHRQRFSLREGQNFRLHQSR